MMKKILKITLFSLLLLFIILTAVVSFLTTTTPGLYASFKIVNIVTSSSLKLTKADGRLLDGFRFKTFVFEDDSQQITIEQGQLAWRALDLLKGTLSIEKIRAKHIQFKTFEPDETIEDAAETASQLPKLPFNINVGLLEIDKLAIQHQSSVQTLKHIQATLQFDENFWSINHLSLEHDNIQHKLQAQLKPHAPYDLKSNLTSTGSLDGQPIKFLLDVQGDFSTYQISGFSEGAVNTKIKGHIDQLNNIDIHANWSTIRWPLKRQQLHIKPGQLQIKGVLSNLLISLKTDITNPVSAKINLTTHVTQEKVSSNFELNGLSGQIKANIDYQLGTTPKFRGLINVSQINLFSLNIPVDQLYANIDFHGHDLKSLHAKYNASGSYIKNHFNIKGQVINEKINTHLSLGPNHLSIQGMPQYQWQIDGLIPKPSLLHPALQGLKTTLRVQGQTKSAQQGQLQLSLGHGTYKVPDGQNVPPIPFNGGNIQLTLNDKGLKTDGRVTIDHHKFLELDLNLPNYRLNKPLKPNQTIQGHLHLKINTLDFLNNITPDIKKIAGNISAVARINGPLLKPIINGRIELSDGRAYLPKADLTYAPISAVLETTPHSWQLKSQITAAGETLSLSGQGKLTPQLTGQLKLQAINFPAIQTAEYKIFASPNLYVDFTSDSMNVTGEVIIPKAEIKPISFSGSQSLSEDVVFVRDKQQSEPLDISADINLKMGDAVQINTKGLTGQLAGGIRIRKNTNNTPFAVGELRIENGKYQAYGQDLTIKEGQLLFSGGVITNPGIRVRAVRFFNNASSRFASSDEMFDFSSGNVDSWGFGDKVTVGIQVTGRVRNPNIELFSIPSSMSQADILSMLILGRPSSQAGQSGGTLLLAALSAMNLDSGTDGTQLLSKLKQNLGFDFNVESSTGYDQVNNQSTDSTSVVIGKAISKRLYLSYNIGLFQNNGAVFTIKYILNKYFNIQVNASDTGSGIDFLYNHTKE